MFDVLAYFNNTDPSLTEISFCLSFFNVQVLVDVLLCCSFTENLKDITYRVPMENLEKSGNFTNTFSRPGKVTEFVKNH